MPCLVHISHEVVRPLGGVGVQIRQLINNSKVRSYFHNRIILAGPMLFPEEGDCRTSTNLETLRTLKYMLDSLARSYPKKTEEHMDEIAKHLHNIERKFNVYLYNYEKPLHDHLNSTIDLLLIDLSSSFGQHFFQCRFVDEIISRINLETGSNLYNLNVHPDQMDLGKRIRDELLNHSGNKLSKDLEDEMQTALAHMKDYRDYNYMLGLAMAEPLACAINTRGCPR